jgi:hypothetical protein
MYFNISVVVSVVTMLIIGLPLLLLVDVVWVWVSISVLEFVLVFVFVTYGGPQKIFHGLWDAADDTDFRFGFVEENDGRCADEEEEEELLLLLLIFSFFLLLLLGLDAADGGSDEKNDRKDPLALTPRPSEVMLSFHLLLLQSRSLLLFLSLLYTLLPLVDVAAVLVVILEFDFLTFAPTFPATLAGTRTTSSDSSRPFPFLSLPNRINNHLKFTYTPPTRRNVSHTTGTKSKPHPIPHILMESPKMCGGTGAYEITLQMQLPMMATVQPQTEEDLMVFFLVVVADLVVGVVEVVGLLLLMVESGFEEEVVVE